MTTFMDGYTVKSIHLINKRLQNKKNCDKMTQFTSILRWKSFKENPQKEILVITLKKLWNLVELF